MPAARGQNGGAGAGGVRMRGSGAVEHVRGRGAPGQSGMGTGREAGMDREIPG